MTVSEGSNRLLAFLYAVASAYSLLQVALGVTGFADPVLGSWVLAGEIVASLTVIAGLLWIGGREYLMSLGFVVLHIATGTALGQWQSPALWVAIAVLFYLVRPYMWQKYSRLARMEMRYAIARHRSRNIHRCRHFWNRLARRERDNGPIPW